MSVPAIVKTVIALGLFIVHVLLNKSEKMSLSKDSTMNPNCTHNEVKKDYVS